MAPARSRAWRAAYRWRRLLELGAGRLECLLGFGHVRVGDVETPFGEPYCGLGAGQLMLSRREPAAQFCKPPLRVAAGTCPVHHEEIMSVARRINRLHPAESGARGPGLLT